MKNDLITSAAAVAVLLCGGMFLHGCKCDASAGAPAKSETNMGSHSVTVKPGSSYTSSSSVTGSEHERYEFKCGDVTVVIDDEELIVNDISYGTLSKGDSILVDAGVVYVEGKQVQGKLPSKPEAAKTTSARPELTQQLAGHLVTVRPGSLGFSVVSAGDIEKLTVGSTQVTIDGDELKVNGSSYGKLAPGDSVLVDHGKVSVSGRPRSAE